ncbi:hypothetical protein RND81_03G023300 [Saponaria officinalis]|uniref:BZIP domain-containing protein n=1 Tax=Saponaria officinalis TaxID=3572 RepID=A0AAW1M3S6_SAPOF
MMNDEIDWENFDFFADASPPFPATESSEPAVSSAAVESWTAELEDLLMKDDDFNQIDGSNSRNNDYFKEFDLDVCDLLLESPEGSSSSMENGDRRNVNVGVINKENSPNFESNCVNENDKSSDDAVKVNNNDDPLNKKRKRQSSNREAAMRSRERKKMLVKDLELKSRYFEEECRRLQRLLHCCYTENQWLRSLQTYGAPMTKPESAVLLLESLLLGSLVWLMVNICLLPQPKLPLLHQDAAVLVSAVPRGKGTKISELWTSLSFSKSKRCRASRTKMKSHFAALCF